MCTCIAPNKHKRYFNVHYLTIKVSSQVDYKHRKTNLSGVCKRSAQVCQKVLRVNSTDPYDESHGVFLSLLKVQMHHYNHNTVNSAIYIFDNHLVIY